jgi:hypothetical protein
LELGGIVLQAVRIGRGQSEPLEVSVSESTDDVTLTLNPLRSVRGIVATPAGEVVAGAILRFISPNFSQVFEVVSGPAGAFSVDLPDTEALVTVVVLPGIYAARVLTMTRVSLDEDVSFHVGNASGTLRVLLPGAPPWPMISTATTSVPLPALLYPADGSQTRRGFGPNGIQIEIETGIYTVCRTSSQCRTVAVQQSGEAVASFINEEHSGPK